MNSGFVIAKFHLLDPDQGPYIKYRYLEPDGDLNIDPPGSGSKTLRKNNEIYLGV